MAPTLLPSFSAVLVVLVALMSRTVAEDRRRPLVLLASDRPKFFGGGKRRSDPPPTESGKSPDLLDEVAGGRYGGGQTILPSLGGPAEPSTTKLPRLFPDPEGASPADEHGFDDDLLTPPAAAAPPPPPPPPPPPAAEGTELDRPGGWFIGEPTETPRPRGMGLLEAIANLRHDEIHGADASGEPVSWTASRSAAPAASALPFLDEPRAPFADLAPVEAWEHAPTSAPAADSAPEWHDLVPPPPPPAGVGEPDPAHAASVAAAWAPVAHVASDENWELVAPPPPPAPAASTFDESAAPAAPSVFDLPPPPAPAAFEPAPATPDVFALPAAPAPSAFALPAAPEAVDPPPAPTAWAMPPAEAPRPAFDLPPAPLVDDLPPAPVTGATPFIGAAPLPPPPPELDADSWHSWQWQPEAPTAAAEPAATVAPPPPPPPPPFAFDEAPAPRATASEAPAFKEAAFEEAAFDEPATVTYEPTAFDEPAPAEEPVSFSWAIPPAATRTTLGPSSAAPRFAFGSLDDFGAPAEPAPGDGMAPVVAAATAGDEPAGATADGSWSDIFDIFGSEDGPADDSAADDTLAEEPVAPWAATDAHDGDDLLDTDPNTGTADDDDLVELGFDAGATDAVWDPAAGVDDGPRTDDDGVEVRWASTLLDRLRSAVAIPAEPAEAIEEFRLRFARGLRLRLTEEQVVQYLAQGVHLLAPDAETQVLLASDGEALDHRAGAGAGVRAGCDVEDADLCPAIVQGETLHFDDSTMLDACPHLTGRGAVACAASCIPLQPHGNVRGVVHVTTLRNATMPGETVEAVERAAQQVSVRLVELRASRRAREERARESADA